MAGFINKKLNAINHDSLFRNGIVAVICVLGMGGSLWFFRSDLNSSLQNLGKKPVGTAYWVTNNAKRLSSRRLQWDRLERHSPIYDGDIVSSDAFSELKISFEGGETLELFPDTSVHIVYQDSNAIRFVLREGEIQIQSSRNALTVSLAEIAPVETLISDIRISLVPGTTAGIKAPGKNAPDGFTLKVYQGSIAFSSRGGGASRTVEAGAALRLGNDGSVRTDPPVIMLAPWNGARLLHASEGKVPVEFRWKRLHSGESEVMLEIAHAGDFSLPEEIWYSDNTDSAEIELAAGTYHWKLYTPSSREEADSGRLDIVYTQGPRALSPADGTVETLLPGKQEILFSWAVPGEAESVVLEVADNSEMNNPGIQQPIKSATRGRGYYSASGLKPGQWYWRVRPVYPGMEAADYPSPVNSFTLAESTELPAQKAKSSTPAAKPGGIPRLIFPPDNYTLEANRTPDLLFSWENTFSYNARFQMADRSDFIGALIMDEEVYGSTIQSPFLKPGTYYWHITGTAPGNASPPNRLVVLPALPGPKLQSPSENERLQVREGEAVRFSWEPANYATAYQFRLFLEGRDIPLREVSSLQNNSVYVYFDPNTSGRFTWIIQGFSSPTEISTGRRGLIARGRFYISPDMTSNQTDQISWTIPRIANMQSFAGKVDAPITLISPMQGINIPGIQALRAPPQARWTSDEPLRNTQLIVSRTTDPESDPRAIVRDVTGYTAPFPSLDEGIWYWIIRGDTSELRGATSGDPSWVNVLPVPLLLPPIPLQPINRVIGIEQLTRDRNITFRWSMVTGANAYIFSLFQDGDPPKLIITAPLQTTVSYVLENLSLLNEGNYLWQVEAVSLDRNGVIEQRGRTEQYPFTIEIPRSGDLETRRMGTLYGQ